MAAVSEVNSGECRSVPTDGVCAFCALAFSTLLSSQGADAHLRRTLIRLQGNRLNLPGEVSFVNLVRQNFANL